MSARLGYRPALDGIRGVAITLVILVHVFGKPDGRVGVDLFFVLSGFLITTLLLEEHARAGAISLRAFYGRRVRRLLPALAFMLIGYLALTTVVAIGTGEWGSLHPALLGALAAGTFSTNLVLAQQYSLAPASLPIGSSLVPLWSLAAEEQFYVLWPLILFLLFRGRRLAAGLFLVVAVGLVAWRQIELLGSRAPEYRLEFAPDTRGAPILIGCLLAILFSSQARSRIFDWARLLAVPAVLLAGSIVSAPVGWDLFENGHLILFSLCAAVLMAHALDERSLFSRLLSVRPLVALGLISYSLYLWHEVIMYTVFRLNEGHPSLTSKLAAIATSLLAATLSYCFVERRFIRRKEAGSAPAPGDSRRPVAQARPTSLSSV